jgi:O-antigen/teichoic acid export membrane protein
MILVLLTGLWLTPFLLKNLGQHNYGLWLIITQLSAYLGLLDLGIIGLLPRETAYAVGRGGVESPELPDLVGQTTRIILLQWPLVAMSAAIAWLLGRSMVRSAELPLGVILTTFVILFPFRLFGSILQGLQDLAFVGRAQIAAWIASTLTSVLLVLFGQGLMALALSWVVNQVIATGVFWYRLKTRFPQALPNRLPGFNRTGALNHLKKGLWISASQVAQILVNGTDLVLIGKLLDPSATVPYSCTGKLASVLANKPQMLMQAAFPALSELKGGGSKPRIRQATMALSQAMLALTGIVACVVLAVNRSFVEWWIGPNQYGGGLLTALIVAAMVMRHWNSTFTYSLFCFGYERRLALTGITDGCVSFFGSAILIYFIGPIGAPIGVLMGTCLVNMPANLTALAREMETTPFALLATSGSWLTRFGAVALGGMLATIVLEPHTVLSIAALAATIGTAYLALMAPVLLREPLGAYIRPRLRHLPEAFRRILPAYVD